MEELKETLKGLSQAAGVAGYEEEVARMALSLFGRYASSVRRDRLGNLIAIKKGQGESAGEPLKVMLAAHMDEIGFMVTGVDRGFIRVAPVGGFDPRTLVNQEVVVHGLKNLPGVFGIPSPEPEEKDRVKLEALYVDTGLSHEELKKVVKVGDPISLHRQFMDLGNHGAAGKAMDDRAGMTVIYACLRELNTMSHRCHVYAVATVQEEVGWRGAAVSSYGIRPHVGIAVDVTHGSLPGVPRYEAFGLGKGPCIGWGPNIHPAVYRGLENTAREYGIPWQKEVIPGSSGTDAMAMQIARKGMATGVVSLPLRYMHTSVETLNMEDLKNAGRLLAFFIKDLDAGFREVLKCF